MNAKNILRSSALSLGIEHHLDLWSPTLWLTQKCLRPIDLKAPTLDQGVSTSLPIYHQVFKITLSELLDNNQNNWKSNCTHTLLTYQENISIKKLYNQATKDMKHHSSCLRVVICCWRQPTPSLFRMPPGLQFPRPRPDISELFQNY